jgi:hypothetical protein
MGIEFDNKDSTTTSRRNHLEGTSMEIFAATALPLAAVGYSLVYLLAGGGFLGAVVIFFIAKMLGK